MPHAARILHSDVRLDLALTFPTGIALLFDVVGFCRIGALVVAIAEARSGGASPACAERQWSVWALGPEDAVRFVAHKLLACYGLQHESENGKRRRRDLFRLSGRECKRALSIALPLPSPYKHSSGRRLSQIPIHPG